MKFETLFKIKSAILATVLCLAMNLPLLPALAGGLETKYDTAADALGCAVLFAPGNGSTVVKALNTSCDTSLGYVSFYARSGTPQTVSAVDASATTCTVVNTGTVITNSDLVVYVYASGAAPEYRTVSSATTTSIVLSSALTGTTSANDKIYEVTLQGRITVGANGAAAATNTLTNTTGDLFATPGDSPLYCTMGSTTNATLQVTVSK